MNAESKGQAVIAAAQSSSVKGDLSGNVRRHCDFVRRAAEHNVELIVFPELSLTGYEPSVTAELATDLHDAHWEPLKSLADESGMTIVAGCPITSGERRPYIGEVIFGPAGNTVYRKRFVHGTEDEHFVASDDVVVVSSRNCQAAMAICADIENAQHPRDALRPGVDVYAAGVAITKNGIARAEASMLRYAREYGVTCLLANYASDTGGFDIAGRSGIWDASGAVVQAEGTGECLVIAGPDGGCIVGMG